MNNIKICAIIPIKHNSQRVPGKNYRLFNDIPLFKIIINTLLESKYINHIIIDTNSDIVKNEILKNKIIYNNITVYDRPLELCSHDTPVNKLLENVITKLDLNYDYYLQTHTTNPLLSNETINNCIETFIKNNNINDSLFTVKKIQSRFYKYNSKIVSALNHNINELIPTQDLEPIYEENSCIYIFSKEILFKKHHRVGFKPYMYVMNDLESQDIDTESDFILSEILYEKNILNKKNIVLITGIKGDIGSAIVKEFKKNNWYIIGIDKEYCKNDDIDIFLHKNIIDKNDFKNIIDFINKNYKKLDCIVNNAAMQICKNIWEFEENEWDDTFNCNLKVSFLLVKNLILLLKNSNNCNIINICSIHSIATSKKISAYSSSKTALVGLTRNLAIELAEFNIRVNAISPGAINTKMLIDGLNRGHCGNNNDNLINLSKKHLLKNIGNPKDVAELCYYITKNNFINGANLIMDGGASILLSTEV